MDIDDIKILARDAIMPASRSPFRSMGVSGSITAAIITQFTVGELVGTDISFGATVDGEADGDTLYVVVYPDGELEPSGPQIKLGDKQTGADAEGSFAYTWPNLTSTAFPTGIARGNYRASAVYDNGELSDVVTASEIFLLDTTLPVLSTPSVVATEDVLNVSVTSDKAFGTIYFALRVSTDAAGTAQDIIDGTANYTATYTDASPTADANNTAMFNGLLSGTYAVDMVQIDDFENTSTIVNDTATVTITVDDFRDDFDTYTNNSPLTTENANYTARENGSPEAQTQSGGIVVGDGAVEGVHYVPVVLDSTNQSVRTTVAAIGSTHYLYIDCITTSPLLDYYSFEINASTGDWAVKRWDAGVATQMNTGTLSPAPAIGDELQFRRQGNALKALINGSEFYTRDSGSTVVHMTGYGGFGCSFDAASSRFRLRKN